MNFKWETLPDIVAKRRARSVQELIDCRTHDVSNWLRGQISAYDEILRLPQDAEEDRLIKEQSDV